MSKKEIEYHKEICEKMTDLYARKNSDYGNSFRFLREKFPNSILYRVFDKYNRLETLLNSKESRQVKDESVEDTLLDLANYCIMELIERKMECDSK